MTNVLSPDVRQRLDDHLDAVERALVEAGHSRERRRGVVDDLEAQILDMLAGRSPEPTVADLEAVLASLDPPAAYGEGGTATAVATTSVPHVATSPAPMAGLSHSNPVPKIPVVSGPRFSRTAIWGFVCVLLSLLPLPLVLVLLYFTFSAEVSRSGGPVPAYVSRGTAVTIEPLNQPTTATATSAPQAYDTYQYATYHSTGPKGLLLSFGITPCMGVFALLGTVLGWVALGQIHLSKGALRGSGLALFDSLFYPTLLLPVLTLITPLPYTLFFLLVVALVIIGVAALVAGAVKVRRSATSR